MEIKTMMWDSEFWEKRIIEICNFSSKDDLSTLSDIDFELAQIFVDFDFKDECDILERNGFNLIETKVTFEYRVNDIIDKVFGNIGRLSLTDLANHQNDFYELYGSVSRFRFMDHDKINLFYLMWLRKSISGTLDDEALGYYIDKELAGFITYKIHQNRIVIGLLGVFSGYQRRGISQNLLNYIKIVAHNRNVDYVQVSTQGSNSIAINTYLKSNFYQKAIGYWYYKMNERTA